MKQPSFLARKPWGAPNYLLVALAAAFLIALAPLGAWRALQSSSNRLERWLPAGHEEAVDLAWYRTQFGGEPSVVVSWEGCTLAETEKLEALARKLSAAKRTEGAKGGALFARVTTGAELIELLTAAPYGLTYEAAAARLEGTLVGPPGSGAQSGDGQARATCLVAHLAPEVIADEAATRQAIGRIREAAGECSIDPATLRMAGPAVDVAAIGASSRASLLRWGAVAVLAGLGLCTWRLGSFKLAAIVVGTGVVSAAASLAMVNYFGLFELLALGRPAPILGRGDALVLAMPMVVYALAIAAALRLVYYYRDARLADGIEGAAERAAARGWPSWLIAPLLLAAALGSLCLSELLPARKFGLFAGLGAIASVAAVLSLLPVFLHRFPLEERRLRRLSGPQQDGTPPAWLNGAFEWGVAARAGIVACSLAAMALAAWGLTKLDSSPRFPLLAAGRSRAAQDFAWLGEHIGGPAPIEVVLTMPLERRRDADEAAEADGQQYRLTLRERMELMRELDQRAAELPQLSGVLSPASFIPTAGEVGEEGDALRQTLETHGLVRLERQAGSDRAASRELWRASFSLAPSAAGGVELDYGVVAREVRALVEPVLLSYVQRDRVVQSLHERGGQLQGAKVCVLFRSPGERTEAPEGSQESMLAELLARSGVADGQVTFFNLASLGGNGDPAEPALERAAATLSGQQAAVLVSAGHDPAAAQLAMRGVNVVDVSTPVVLEESEATAIAEAGGPRPIRAVYTGTPLAALAAQDGLLATLRESAAIVAAGLALVMMFVVWNPVGGMASLVPILFPMAIALGAWGWAGLSVDIGILLAASLALGVALDGTVNFLAWFRRGSAAGLFREEAARMAYCRVAPGMLDTLLVAGVGLLALAASGIASVQLLGLLTAPMMAAAMVGCLVVLPAVVTGPLGRFFGAEEEPSARAVSLSPVKVAAPHFGHTEPAPGPASSRTDAAAVANAPAPHRGRPQPADDRHEAEAPHAALQAKLRQLRRPAGDSSAP